MFCMKGNSRLLCTVDVTWCDVRSRCSGWGMYVYRLRDCLVLYRICAYYVGCDVSVWLWEILSMRPRIVGMVRGAEHVCYILLSVV